MRVGDVPLLPGLLVRCACDALARSPSARESATRELASRMVGLDFSSHAGRRLRLTTFGVQGHSAPAGGVRARRSSYRLDARETS